MYTFLFSMLHKSAMLYYKYAMLYGTQCYMVWYYFMPHYTLLWHTLLCNGYSYWLFIAICNIMPCFATIYIRIHCYHTILCFIHYTLPNLVMPCHSIAHCILLNTTLYCSVQFHTKPDWIYFWIYAINHAMLLYGMLHCHNAILYYSSRRDTRL